MPRFIALPVGQGDAFYLDRGDWSALVDGGRGKASFGTTFCTMTGAHGVDVLVCTHNDADHANGILGFLESGLGCGEVWLPGRWLDALPGVLRPFAEVFVNLAEEVAQEELVGHLEHSPPAATTPLEQLAERLEDWPQDRAADTPLGEDGWSAEHRAALEEAEPWEADGWPWLGDPELWVHPPHGFLLYLREPARIRLLWSAIEAARRIREIALAAFHRGIRVVWFEYDVGQPGGGCTELRPLNARAIARVRPVVGKQVALLALTVANKESLVFWSPRSADVPGVLFTADSDLNNVQLPSSSDIAEAIATAPHHGSEANANAYSAVASAAGAAASSLTWVRSDGRSSSRPGATYMAVSGRRLCTICRLRGGGASLKRPVHLFASRGGWSRHRATPMCTCRIEAVDNRRHA
jgi:hypothetical protein